MTPDGCGFIPVPAVPKEVIVGTVAVLYTVSSAPNQLESKTVNNGADLVRLLVGSSATASAEGRAMEPTAAQLMLGCSDSFMAGSTISHDNKKHTEAASDGRRRLASGKCFDECSCLDDASICICPISCKCGRCECRAYASVCTCENCTEAADTIGADSAVMSDKIRGTLVDTADVFAAGMVAGELCHAQVHYSV